MSPNEPKVHFSKFGGTMAFSAVSYSYGSHVPGYCSTTQTVKVDQPICTRLPTLDQEIQQVMTPKHQHGVSANLAEQCLSWQCLNFTVDPFSGSLGVLLEDTQMVNVDQPICTRLP